jgi:hypothetical protein
VFISSQKDPLSSSDCPTCKWKTVLISKEKYHSENQNDEVKNRRIHLNRDSFVIVVAGVLTPNDIIELIIFKVQ